MEKLTRNDLFSLEQYAQMRSDFKAKVMAHKKKRILKIGDHATFHFEDRFLMHYQVQEMLRAERIFESEGIQDELDAYNPLIPDGSNFKVTFMIEYADEEERKQALAKLIGIEGRAWVKVDGFDKVYAIADEDLERETTEKTSSVHFLRFELTPEMVAAAKEGAPIGVGFDHEAYPYKVDPIPDDVRASLVEDLD
jgi:hypothetical protein